MEDNANELMRQALAKIRELKAQVNRLQRPAARVAIVGRGFELAGGVNTSDRLWEALSSGADQFSELPPLRWQRMDKGIYTHRAAYLEPSSFDPLIFSISPRESRFLDPQHKLLLKTVWWALEDAGIGWDEIAGTDTGIYVALSSDDFAQRVGASLADMDAHSALGSGRSMAAGRLGYLLDSHGPVMTVDTACSSSLVVLHLAAEDLRNGRIDRAIVAGANLILDPSSTLAFCRLGALSPSGVCRSFDERGDGYVRGEGGVALVLEREADALDSGRRIHSVVLGSAIGHDGESNGLTAPNGRSQELVIRRALTVAGLSPNDIDYVEAHATGTVLGDPVELQALSRVMDARTVETPVLVGTIKSAFGHLEAAAGLASVLRTIEIINRGIVPPQANFGTPNSRFPWAHSRLALPSTEARAATVGSAGVSAFGMSGTNAHVILAVPARDAAQADDSGGADRWAVRLSAPNVSALEAQVLAAQRILKMDADAPAGILTGSPGSKRTPYRVAIEAPSGPQLHDRLGRALAHVHPVHAPASTVAGFGGQGGRLIGAEPLERRFPAYRRRMAQAREIFHDLAGRPLPDVLEEAVSPHDGQVATVAHQLAVADVLEEAGWRPTLWVGYSLGEYAAAVGAGVMTPEDALTLMTQRTLLCAQLGPVSKMMLIDGPADVMAEAVGQLGLAPAIVITPTRMVVSTNGRNEDEVVEGLRAAGLLRISLAVPAPFHTDEMREVAAGFEPVVRAITLRTPEANVVGGVAGRAMHDPRYWTDHLTETLRFDQVLRAMAALPDPLLVEVGGPPGLGPLVRGDGVIRRENQVPTIRDSGHPVEDLRDALARLYTAGSLGAMDRPLVGGGRRSLPYQFTGEPLIPEVALTEQESPGRTAEPGAERGGVPDEPVAVEFDRADAEVGDHTIAGSTIIPAAYHVRLYRDAAVARGFDECALTDIEFRAPILVEGGPVKVQLVESVEEGRSRLALVGADGEIHSQCLVEAGGMSIEHEPLDLDAAHDREVLDTERIYSQLHDAGYQLGPSYRRIRAVSRVGSHGAQGLIEDGQGSFGVLQPGTVDSAFQVLAIAVQGSDAEQTAPSVPFFIERIDFASDLSSPDGTYEVDAAVSTYQADSGHLTGGLVVRDRSHRPMFRVSGLHARRVAHARHGVAEPCRLRVDWEPYLGSTDTIVWGRTVVVADNDVRWVLASDEVVPWARGDGDAQQVGEAFVKRLVAAIRGDNGACSVVLCPSVDGNAAKSDVWGLLRCLSTLDRADLLRVRWVIATEGGTPDGLFVPHPLGASLAAIFRSASLEIPEVDWWWVHSSAPVDLTQHQLPFDARMTWLDGATLRIPHLVVEPWSAGESCAALAVIGASGTIGGAVLAHQPTAVAVVRDASSEVAAGREHLILPSDPEGQAALMGSLSRLPHDAGSRVVHAAGIAADASLATLSWELFSDAWDAKVPMTQALAEGGAPGVVASTLAAVLGSPGQAAYAAVNGFVEGVARRVAGGQLVCVALGPVAGSSMVEAAQQRSANWERVGLTPMPAAMAGDALLTGIADIVVLGDAAGLSRAVRGFGNRAQVRQTTQERVDLSTQPPAERAPLVAAMLTERLANVLHVDVDQVSEDRRLLELGVDSLMSLEIRTWLQTTFGVTLGMDAMFNDATVRSVSALVAAAAEGSDETEEVLL